MLYKWQCNEMIVKDGLKKHKAINNSLDNSMSNGCLNVLTLYFDEIDELMNFGLSLIT